MTMRRARGDWALVLMAMALLAPLARAADPEPAKKDGSPATQPGKDPAPAAKPSEQNSKSDAADDEPAPATDAASSAAHDRETLEMLKVFVDSLDQIERNYVKPVDRRELMEAAIQGMLEKLDPHSSYIAPKEVDRFRSTVESQFGGIGIQVSVENGLLKIITPLVGTPAYRAGLMAGDTILEIEGKPAAGVSIDEAVRRLKGPIGSKVSVTVQHLGNGGKQSVTLTREIVHVETVLGDRRGASDQWDFMYDREKRIGYIRVTSFGRDTAGDLRRALEQLQKEKMRALVLDLRFNPGGLLTSAIEICDLFIDKGRIVSTKGRNVKERIWEAKAEGTFGDFPMAILVNHYSASASEIVSACLQDHRRAVVVGERSWGKGSVQNVIDLEDGKSVLKLTTASYWRPSGKNIHRFPDAKDSDDWGVRPDKDFEVALATEEMRQLVEDRRQRDIVLPHATEKQPEAPQVEAPKTPAESSKDKKSDATSSTPSVGGVPKPAEAKQDQPKDTKENKPPDAKETKPAATLPDGSKPAVPHVDRQLQRALEYLHVEMARAS